MPRQRDYRAEYEMRVARGLGRGLSRSQARGHPGLGQPFVSPRVIVPRYDPVLEEGLRTVREGGVFTRVARDLGVSSDRLRRYLAATGVGVREGGRWRVGKDRRHRRVVLYSRGRAIEITVAGYDESAGVGSYMNAVGQFAASNDLHLLAPYRGAGVIDVRRRFHPYEIDPGALYRLLAAGPEPFEQIYRIVL